MKTTSKLNLTADEKQLVDAIRAIPSIPGVESDNDKFKLFVQTTLVAIWEGRRILDRAMGQATRGCLNTEILGFKARTDADWAPQLKGLNTAAETYLKQVQKADAFTDLLCVPYIALCHGNPKLAQHFTTSEFARQMMMFDPVPVAAIEKTAREKGDFKVAYPCCGAGALMLAWLRKLNEDAPANIFPMLTLYASDIDPQCSAVATLQLLVNVVLKEKQIGKFYVSVGDEIDRETKVVAFALESDPYDDYRESALEVVGVGEVA